MGRGQKGAPETHGLQSCTEGRGEGAVSRVPRRKGLPTRTPHWAPQVAATLGALQPASLPSLDVSATNCLLRLEPSSPPCVPWLPHHVLSQQRRDLLWEAVQTSRLGDAPGMYTPPCVHTCMHAQVLVHVNAHAHTHTTN